MNLPRWLRWRSDSELEEELAAHIEIETRMNIDRGMSPEEARNAARRAFGNTTRVAETARESDPFGWLNALRQDARYALRGLVRNPGFAAVAILSLALGIGANTAAFSLINRVLFRPLPIERPSDFFALNSVQGKDTTPSFSYPNYKDLRDRTQTMSGVVAYRVAPAVASHEGANSRMWGYLVSGNYFDVLGVHAAAGRLITPADDVNRGGHPVVVLTWKGWQRRFGGDQRIIGATIHINGLPYTVLGVTPPDFHGTELLFYPDVFVPLAMVRQIEPGFDWIDSRRAGNLFVAGRVKPGMTAARAEAELNSVAAGLAREYPAENEGLGIGLSPAGLIGTFLRGAVIGFTGALQIVTILVLLIACANLIGLQLARAADRRKEIAIRLALGSGKRRLIRQMLTESFLLASAGAAAGLLFAVWITNAIAAWKPPIDVPVDFSAGIDLRVLAFTAAITVVTAVLFGLAPALQALRTDLVSSMKNTVVMTVGRWTLRDTIVGLQVALSVMLLAGSALVLRSLRNALTVPLGFETKGSVIVTFDLSLQGYDEARGRAFQRRLIEKAQSLPGIESAALLDRLPLGLDFSRNGIYVDGKPAPKASKVPQAYVYEGSPGYFRTVRTRLIAGREFDNRDVPGGVLVAIVNKAFADRLLPGENPLGKSFRFNPKGNARTIVGVVETGKYMSLSESNEPALWTNTSQDYSSLIGVVAHSPMPESQTLKLLRNAVLEIDPKISFYQAGTLDEHLGSALLPARLAASALGSFGGMALVLAAIGIYGLMAYSVARRTREFGIRIALGANVATLLATAFSRAAILMGAGIALGAICAGLAGPLYGAILYGVNSRDPGTLAIACLLIIAIGLGASVLPARRALRIQPTMALREE